MTVPTAPARTQPTPAADSAGVVAPPPLLFGGAVAAGSLLQARIPVALLPAAVPQVVAATAGWVLVVGGLTLGASAVATLRGAGTNVDPGRSTTAVVTSGPYRWTRNPIYVGFATLIAGVGVLADTLWIPLLGVPVLITVHYGVIKREERYLRRTFGASYAGYVRRVRRWL